MNKLEKARWRNILRKAAKANRLFKKGYLVFDHNGHRFNGFNFENGMLYEGNKDYKSVWLSKDKLWGESFRFTIKEFNTKHFDKWQAVHPGDAKKI